MSTLAVPQAQRNKRTAMFGAGLALAMLGMGYAAVPLYDLFCRVTGLDGTTGQISAAEAAEVKALDKTISVRFDANVAAGMPWRFRPETNKDTVAIGARDMAVYLARNDSNVPITGTATFNVTPVQAGQYFNKIQCFCFTEQTLMPGQEMRMPVLFQVDPAILDDPDARDIEQITLSYTFYETPNGG